MSCQAPDVKETDHSPMGWRGMNAPDQPPVMSIGDKGTDYSSKEWGGMKEAPSQSPISIYVGETSRP